MSNIVLSPNYSAAIVGLAYNEGDLPDGMILERDDEYEYSFLGRLVHAGFLESYASEVKDIVLSHDHVSSILPAYYDGGANFVTRRGVFYLNSIGILSGDIIEPEYLASSEKEKTVDTMFWNEERQIDYYIFAAKNPALFVTNFYNTFFSDITAYASEYGLFKRHYAERLEGSLPGGSETDFTALFIFLCLYSIGTCTFGGWSIPGSLKDAQSTRLRGLSSFYRFLSTEYSNSLLEQGGWLSTFYKSTAPIADVIELVRARLSIHVAECLHSIPFKEYFRKEISPSDIGPAEPRKRKTKITCG